MAQHLRHLRAQHSSTQSQTSGQDASNSQTPHPVQPQRSKQSSRHNACKQTDDQVSWQQCFEHAEEALQAWQQSALPIEALDGWLEGRLESVHMLLELLFMAGVHGKPRFAHQQADTCHACQTLECLKAPWGLCICCWSCSSWLVIMLSKGLPTSRQAPIMQMGNCQKVANIWSAASVLPRLEHAM